MVKVRSQFVCQQCGASYGKWAGRCENCGEWNTLVEQAPAAGAGQSLVAKAGGSGKKLTVQSIANAHEETFATKRISSGTGDLDTVLEVGLYRVRLP